MTKIIVNADDFGYSRGVNFGIIDAYQKGIVTSTTLMMNMAGTVHAMNLASKNKDLGVGIHFVLDLGTPINPNVPSLVSEKGIFYKRTQLFEKAISEDIEKELTSQLEKFLSFGRMPTHIDSHHHVHGHGKVFPIVKKLAKKYSLPLRQGSSKSDEVVDYGSLKTVDYFTRNFYGKELDVHKLKGIIQKATAFDTTEIMVHPGYVDEAILNGSSYNLQRINELEIIIDDEIKHYVDEKNIHLITYKDI